MGTLTITKDSGNQVRTYQVELLSYITGSKILGSAQSESIVRPLWMTYTGSERDVRLFNSYFLNRTEKASYNQYRRRDRLFECLKSLGYRHFTQKVEDRAITTVYLPYLFSPNPGKVNSSGIQFVALVDKSWLDQQKFDKNLILGFAQSQRLYYMNRPVQPIDLDSLVPESLLFMLYLDRRTRYPMPTDVRFALQLYLRCLDFHSHQYKIASRITDPRSIVEEVNTGSLNLKGICFSSTHETFSRIISEEVQKWHS